METTKLLIGTIVGAITIFLLGWLVYGMLLMDFMASNAGTAVDVNKAEPELLHLFIGNLFTGLLYTIILGNWAKASSVAEGFKVGLIVGLLTAAGLDFVMYATTNMMTMTAAAADIVAWGLISGIACAVITMTISRGAKAA